MSPDVAINLERGCLLRGEREIRLRAKTFQVLAYLHEHRGRLVAKDDLFRVVWPDTFVSDDSLTKCIREIREALGDDNHQLLKTVARRGFILDAQLATVDRARDAPVGRPAHNLPATLTSFIGREREVAELARRLPATRLLTLMGAGGCGKTRLAVEVARQAIDRFRDGVWLADLAPLNDQALVAQTVATVLEVRQVPNRALADTLADQLRTRQLLLILDNCEHLIAASAELADRLLRTAADLTILATSREALGIAGETTWRVPSLTLPDPNDTDRSGDLLQYEAVRLLAERAAAVDSSFSITTGNAGTAADVCRRLDGIPLAIELAAARLSVLSIEQIGARLDDRFRLLGQSDRTPIGRQRTLEATVGWSYDLLEEPERLLLRRLSTFAGGWTLDAAEHVCDGDVIVRAQVLDLLSRLVDKSLVNVDKVDAGVDDARRYRFLETMRQYARERLLESGEAARVRDRHLAYFNELARRAEPELMRRNQIDWLNRLNREHDNLRAALDWCLTSPDDRSRPGVELAAALAFFWMKRGYLREGQEWIERTLSAGGDVPVALRARSLMGLGTLTFFQGDFARTHAVLEESAALGRDAGDLSIAAFALGISAVAALEGGDFAACLRLATEGLAAAREGAAPWVEGPSLASLGYLAMHAGDYERAGRLHEELLEGCRREGEKWGMTIVLFDLALLRVVQERRAEARALCDEAIVLSREFGDRRGIAWSLGILSAADAAEGRTLRAARLRGAMEGLLDSVGAPVQTSYHQWVGDRSLEAMKASLGDAAFAAALAEGRAMSLSQAIEYAGDVNR